MGMKNSTLTVLLTTLAGAIAGFFILHPYTAIVFGLYEGAPSEPLARLFYTFQPETVLRSLPYAVAGGCGGLFFGLWLVALGRKADFDRKTCAIDTMKGLMVTMAHYLVNASTVIGMEAGRLEKRLDDPDLARRARIISEEAENIVAVVNALRKLESIETERYTEHGESMMIDIKKKLEDELKRLAETHVDEDER